jgi:hypothetical protein
VKRLLAALFAAGLAVPVFADGTVVLTATPQSPGIALSETACSETTAISPCVADDSPAPPPPPPSTLLDGLFAVWTLDEASGETRVDTVGVYDLTDNNTVGASAGKNNNAADFVGAGQDYLSRADGGSGDETRLAGDFTVSFWANPTGHATTQMLITRDNEVTRGYAFYYNTSQQIVVQMPNDAGGLNSAGGLTSTDTLTDGSWNLVIVDFKQSTKELGVTINGGTRKTLTLTETPGASTAPLNFGREAFTGFPFYLTGSLDEAYMWDRVLTSDERDELWAAGVGSFYTFSPTPAPSTLLTDLISYWNMDEVSGDRADSHGTNTLVDTNTVGSEAGARGNAAKFVALDLEYFTLADNGSTVWGEDGNGASLSLWFKPNGAPATYAALFGRDSLADDDRTFQIFQDGAGSQNVFIEFNSGSRIQTAGGNFTDGVWNHLVVTFDPADKKQRAYIGGVLVLTSLAGAGTSLLASSAGVVIGAWPSLTAYVNGSIDEVAIYNKVLSGDEIACLLNDGVTPPAYPFTEVCN